MEQERGPNNPAMDFPQDFRCPISMELMEDPVTISTGVTYERKNIEKWIFTYKKKTCPTTMQSIYQNYDITPNHTLKRLILAWNNKASQLHSSPLPPPPPLPPISVKHDEIVSILNTIDSTPFKVNSLKKLNSIISNAGNEVKLDFLSCGGLESLVRILVQILGDCSDFMTFRACEEALGVLNRLLILSDEDETIQLLSKPESMKSMAIMLQKGSAEARSNAIAIYRKMARADYDWNSFIQDQGIDFFKSLLELVSDEMCSKASSCALEVLIEILSASKKSRLKAIEAGAICTLIELLPDLNNGSKCEKMLMLIKLICECAEGRLAMVDHCLGIAAVTKKMLNVSDTATKISIKILWLICCFHPTEKVLEEMLMHGSVKNLLLFLHIGGRSSTKDKVVKIFKLHGNSWRRYPCFPCELKDYLGLV